MIPLPPRLSLEEARLRWEGLNVVVWSTRSVSVRLRPVVPWPVHEEEPVLTGDTEWLVAVGGGTLMDRAKLLRTRHPSVKLAAVPTLWGSGAEASPVAVWNEAGAKMIRVGPELLPDVRVIHPDFARTVPDEMARHACGDAWSHALEGFFSPLSSDAGRTDLGEVLRRMVRLPLGHADDWFEVGALACAGQAASSVGLVHGIAHVLEGGLGWGHARLCSLFLLPVMTFNQRNGAKWASLEAHGVSEADVFSILRRLFCADEYAAALPGLRTQWGAVLRNPCTRTNSALVRPADIAFFEGFPP